MNLNQAEKKSLYETEAKSRTYKEVEGGTPEQDKEFELSDLKDWIEL